MLLNLTQKKCPLCSLLLSGARKFLYRFFGISQNCREINRRTYDSTANRVAEINAAAPDCACEKYRMSKHSSKPVENPEIIARFVFSPLHINLKNGEVKPNIFSHVFSAGCSVQRESVATNNELITFTNDFLSRDEKRSWKGVLLAECHELRSIKMGNSSNRSACVYDTAEKANPAHGEICKTQHIVNPEDEVELRAALFSIFKSKAMTSPLEYRDGVVLSNLPTSLQSR